MIFHERAARERKFSFWAPAKVAGQGSVLSMVTRNDAFVYAFLPQKSLFFHQSKGSFCDAILIITKTKMTWKQRGTILLSSNLHFHR